MLLVHFLTILARLLGPGGTRAVVAETLLIKHQLVVLNRSRRRAPNLTATDRIAMGLCTLFMNPSRIRKAAAALKPTTFGIDPLSWTPDYLGERSPRCEGRDRPMRLSSARR